MFETQRIPGMIEPVEQQLLTQLARNAAAGRIVEFGTFFGRSTACLVNGAEAWWSPTGGAPAVEAYDNFACRAGGGFAKLVRSFAAGGGVEPLVTEAAGRVEFLGVFRHYLGPAEASGLLRTHICELRDSTHDGAPISLMHIDAPKFYDELRFVLFRFFPSLQTGATVVFQDFFYHWSATSVAAAQLLVEAGILRFDRSAASAMATTVLRTPSAEELLELDLKFASTPVDRLLDRAIAAVASLPLDRPEVFLPRIELAKVQHHWVGGEHRAAQGALAQMIKRQGGRFGPAVFADFMELLAHGFDIRSAYELDH